MTPEELQKSCTVRIVDDDDGLRGALELMVSYAGWKVETYPDARSFLSSLRMSVPGCVVLDYMMPGMNGLELQRELDQRGSSLPVIFLTGHADLDVAIQGFKGGAADFLTKPVDEEKLLHSIEEQCAKSLAASRGIPTGRELRKIIAGLTEREKSVFFLMREGLDTAAISARLGISTNTVYVYRAGLYRKLGTKDFSEIEVEE